MNNSLMYLFGAIAFFVVAAAAGISVATIRRQQHKETDEGMDPDIVKHYILLNPALIAYVLFPVCIAAGAYLLYLYLY
jgi:hypothetical protein